MYSDETTHCQLNILCGVSTKMTMNGELWRVSKEMIVAYFKVLSKYLLAGNKERSGRRPRQDSWPREWRWNGKTSFIHSVFCLTTGAKPPPKRFLTEVFPCFFLGCKANARVILAKTGHGPHSSKIVVLFYVLFILYRSMYYLCVNVYCHRVTTQLQLTNMLYHIIWLENVTASILCRPQ